MKNFPTTHTVETVDKKLAHWIIDSKATKEYLKLDGIKVDTVNNNLIRNQQTLIDTSDHQGTQTTTTIWTEKIFQLSIIILLLVNLLVEF